MKKKLALILTVVLSMGLFAGCGSDEGKSVGEIKTEKYVTLGEYKGLNVNVAAPTVDEAEQADWVQQIYYGNLTAEYGITDRAVKTGDMVNIDYEGKKDDVAFDGGTAANQQLGIGSGSFIDGFEEGLVGVMPGETVDLNLTFPDPYLNNPDLAGQPVVFTVTVNYIYPTEYKDEAVASWGNSNFSTVAGLEQYVYDNLYADAESNYQYSLQNAVMEAFMSQCVFKEIPESMVTEYRNSLQTNMESDAAMYGMDAETLCLYAYGMDLTTFLDTYAEESAKQILAFQAVANAEDLNMTDEELENELMEFATANGYATVDEFIGENTREDYKEYYMFNDVLEFLVSNAVVTAE